MIPKILHQIWVGPLPPPTKWLNTWVEKHPKWQHRLWGNEELKNKSWTNQRHIDSYIRRGLWSGVADIMRYQILYEFGGIMTAADSECLHPLDRLFRNNVQGLLLPDSKAD